MKRKSLQIALDFTEAYSTFTFTVRVSFCVFTLLYVIISHH